MKGAVSLAVEMDRRASARAAHQLLVGRRWHELIQRHEVFGAWRDHLDVRASA
jgi:hypothetical protein